MTEQTERIFRALLSSDLGEGLHGFELGRQSGLPSGTVHPILARWEKAGILESYWEDLDADAAPQTRPRRRYYRFTPDGAEYARVTLAAADNIRRRAAGSGHFGGVVPIPDGM